MLMPEATVLDHHLHFIFHVPLLLQCTIRILVRLLFFLVVGAIADRGVLIFAMKVIQSLGACVSNNTAVKAKVPQQIAHTDL